MTSKRLGVSYAVACSAALFMACSADDETFSTVLSSTAGSNADGASGRGAAAGAPAGGGAPEAANADGAGRIGGTPLPVAGATPPPPAAPPVPMNPPPAAAPTPATMPAAPPPAMAPAPATPPGTWPAADPTKAGPFPTMTEEDVGPGLGYLLIRPRELTQRHPLITWGNGTGGVPQSYGQLLTQLATHGFIVIASNIGQVAMDQPPPMLEGVKWALEQDLDMSSPLFGKIDRDRIGATGHSQGAFATSSAGTDPLIKTIAPIQALGGSRGFHGPVLGICGTMDEFVPCSSNLRSFSGITDQPAMYAEALTEDHSAWIFSAQGLANPIYVITTAWFRVHLLDDQALRPMFYGECTLCKDTATWSIMRARMDN